MFVPAIAFAWWLVALPMKTLPVAALAAASAPAGGARTVHAVTASTVGASTGPNGVQGIARAQETKPLAPAPHADADADDDTPVAERIPIRGVIPTNVVHAAQKFLDLPLGAERRARIDETDYLFVLEWHYHPPGFVGGPTGWHKGVTVYLTR